MPSAISEIMHRVAQHRAAALTNMTDGKYIRDIYLHQSSFVSHFLPHTYTDLDNTIHPGMNCHKHYANHITISHGYQYHGAQLLTMPAPGTY